MPDRSGFARFTNTRYSMKKEDITNTFIHLTNVAIQKHAPGFDAAKVGGGVGGQARSKNCATMLLSCVQMGSSKRLCRTSAARMCCAKERRVKPQRVHVHVSLKVQWASVVTPVFFPNNSFALP